MLQIRDVVTSDNLARLEKALTAGNWTEGQLANAKARADLSKLILEAAHDNGKLLSAALPVKTSTPMIRRFETDSAVPSYVTPAIQSLQDEAEGKLRTDLAATLFLSQPGDYDGGELIVGIPYNEQLIKLPAGHLFLCPAGELRGVRTVTRGLCFVATFWIQSMVRDNAQRRILFELDSSVQELREAIPDHLSVAKLTGVYNNLLRYWARP